MSTKNIHKGIFLARVEDYSNHLALGIFIQASYIFCFQTSHKAILFLTQAHFVV